MLLLMHIIISMVDGTPHGFLKRCQLYNREMKFSTAKNWQNFRNTVNSNIEEVGQVKTSTRK